MKTINQYLLKCPHCNRDVIVNIQKIENIRDMEQLNKNKGALFQIQGKFINLEEDKLERK